MKRWMQTGGALMLIAALLLAGCVPVPQPEQPAAAGVNVRTEKALNVQNDLDVGGTITGASSLVMEGATDDDYETTFAVTDATADRTITIPNSTGTIALNPYGASIEFEGATANDFETTLTVTDPTTPDKTITLPDATGTVMLESGDQRARRSELGDGWNESVDLRGCDRQCL